MKTEVSEADLGALGKTRFASLNSYFDTVFPAGSTASAGVGAGAVTFDNDHELRAEVDLAVMHEA